MGALHFNRQQIKKELQGNERFVIWRRDFVAAYRKSYETGQLKRKLEEALNRLHACEICPRTCKANRSENKTGICGIGRFARVASAFPHFGEEDCLRGWKGSGTIFFGGCNLRCVFCQNFDISQLEPGRQMTASELAEVMLALQDAGCHNINLVTPTHVMPQILEALLLAAQRGLSLPLVYNTGAYDSLETIQLLDGVVDIYMPDFKLWDVSRSAKYLTASDYPQKAQTAIKAMHAQVGVLKTDEDGLALRGLLVRHLVMPGLLDDTRTIMRWLATELSPDTYVNLMSQYQPAHRVKTEQSFSEIRRRITIQEWELAIEAALQAGLWRLDSRRITIPF